MQQHNILVLSSTAAMLIRYTIRGISNHGTKQTPTKLLMTASRSNAQRFLLPKTKNAIAILCQLLFMHTNSTHHLSIGVMSVKCCACHCTASNKAVAVQLSYHQRRKGSKGQPQTADALHKAW
jgi:hypothetical protein